MAEAILIGIIHDKISPDILFKWISQKNYHSEGSAECFQFTCTVGDFISHFLNYIHENAPSYDIENSNKTTSTPKTIYNTEINKSDHRLTLKKRPALYSEAKTDPKVSHSQTCPVISTKCSYDHNTQNIRGDFKSSGTSTPKLMKINPDTSVDNSYASPISPLYLRNNFNTPKNRSVLKSSEKGLCLGDFIVQKKSSSKKKVQRSLCEVTNMQNSNTEGRKYRRINPTNLNEKRFNSGFKQVENSFNFQNNFVELPVDNLNDQRNMLVEERLKIKNNIEDLIKTPNTVKLQTFNNKIEIDSVPEKVNYIQQLDNLIRIYVFLLNNNLTLNIATEMHFLISLLLSKQYINYELHENDADIQMISDNVENQADLFKTVHNCIYFAVNVLRSQTLLKTFDRPTLKMLYENERVKLFSEEFHSTLLSMYNNKLEQTRENIEIVHNNVCFMSDTDNRENFATDASFHAFRKQRDLFYEILRIWERNHYLPEWNFGMALSGKIRSLLHLYNDPVNYRHFTRLFKMQLLTTCRQSTKDEVISEQQASILVSLPNIDADKLHRLKNRLVTKQENNDLNSTPTFTGSQEFYKDFILASGSHIFYEYLRDSLILEITQLTGDTFGGLLDNEENDYTVDPATRNSYFTSLKFLRILAKFLGLLDSLPYKMDFKTVSDRVLKAEINTRKWFQPSFDFESIILNSLKDKTLVLTIPWVCTYLSMLDYVTIRLPYFEKILNMLFYIHHSTRSELDDDFLLIYNKTLIRLSSGWLFELPHFPSELYFNWISKLSNKDASNSLYLNLNNLSIKKNATNTSNIQGLSLDELDIVDQTILYTFCPYLEGFRKLLLANSSNTGNVVKHITPLSTVENSSDVSEKKLRCQLEDAFFNCQPVSIRKTVEFISERVASSCVKHICNNIVPEFKKSSLEDAKSNLRQFIINSDLRNDDEGKLEAVLKNKINDLIDQYLKQLQEICTAESEKLTKDRIAASIDALLAIDELEQTKDTCVMITKRLCIDRIQQWLHSHVNLGLFNKFKTLHFEAIKILDSPEKDLRDKPVFQLPSGGRNTDHNSQALNAVRIVEIIRNLSLDLIESKPIESAYISDLFKSIEKTVLERCDVNDQILCVINRMLVELILLLITHKMEYVDDNLPLFVNHWETFNKTNEDLFKSLICSRNIMLMAQSKNIGKSWSYLSKFIIQVLEKDLLSCESFESQCIAMYQHEWDKITLKYLSMCFQDVIDGINKQESNSNKFTYLLSFMSSFCVEMDF